MTNDNPNYIEAQDILNATNNGLDIIHDLYPQSIGCELDRKKKFKIREEKSASANLYKGNDDVWLVTDFGGDNKSRNGIGCYMEEYRVDYVTALRELAVKYNVISGKTPEELNRAAYNERPADPDDQEGKWTWETNKELTQVDIDTIVSKNTVNSLKWKFRDEKDVDKAVNRHINETFRYYRWHSLTSYSLIKNRKVMTFSATEKYPIFLIDEGTHQKLYQPLHPDKGKRFMYIGEKPKDYVHGLDQLKKLFEKKKKKAEGQKNEAKENADRTGVATEDEDKEVRVKEAIICSGGSDAINVALIGYEAVLWLNSETAKLLKWQHDAIMICAVKLYQLQDIDATGKRSAHELALEYLDIFTIELPDELKKYRDKRRNPCKDVRDFLNHYPAKEFHELVDIALPYRFWEQKPKYEGKGEDRERVGWTYVYDNVQANNFLQKSGFGRLLAGDKKTEWLYVQRTGNVVREVDSGIIQDFLHNFLETRRFDKDLRNAMLQTSRLNDGSLSRLKLMDIEFEDYTRHSQFFFFHNKTVEITATDIIHHRPGTIERFIWQEDQLPHRIEKPEREPFTITKDPELGNYDIVINNHDCLFLKYLIQTSRVHWRTELETGEKILAMTPVEQDKYRQDHHCVIDGPNLSPEEIEEQKQHLINKIFAIGFLLHHYHDRTKGWFVWGMDNKINDDGKSHGGSGKSILFDVAMRKMLPKNFYINGRNQKLTEDPHKYDGLTEHHKYILIDDAHEYLKLDTFYTDITGDIQVNPKGKKPYSIPFEQAGKFTFTTNYTPRDLGPSTERRMVYSVFSDYYHNKGETDDYKEFRDPKVDLGVTLFVDFDHEHWNHFYNTMLYCLKFFLGTDEKIRPAMENVNKRNLLALMGQAFHDWALAYFNPDSGRLDKFFVREEAKKVFDAVNKGEITPQAFRDKMRAFCRYYGYVFNPKAYQDAKGKIIKKVEPKVFRKETTAWEPIAGAVKETKEVWFIQTRDQLPADPMIGWPEEPSPF